MPREHGSEGDSGKAAETLAETVVRLEPGARGRGPS
jgi:hypothetical protein